MLSHKPPRQSKKGRPQDSVFWKVRKCDRSSLTDLQCTFKEATVLPLERTDFFLQMPCGFQAQKTGKELHARINLRKGEDRFFSIETEKCLKRSHKQEVLLQHGGFRPGKYSFGCRSPKNFEALCGFHGIRSLPESKLKHLQGKFQIDQASFSNLEIRPM